MKGPMLLGPERFETMASMKGNYRAKLWLALPITILVAGVFWRGRNEPFTKEKWDGASPEMRDRLLASLANSRILIGRSEHELYELPGEPDGGRGGTIAFFLGSSHDANCQPSFVVTYGTDQTVQSQNLSCLQEEAGNAIFESGHWRNGTPNDRLAMVRDLIASRHLLGRTREEVRDMLGRPDTDSHTSHLKVWYTRRYLEDGKIKKRLAGISRCLYIEIRNGRVEKAEFVGS